MADTTARAVRFDRYGGRDVLYVTDIPMPEPKDGEVLVEIRAAAINPGEASIRSGAMHERVPATFPSGEGSDLAGVVVSLGPGVSDFAVGDEVLGFSWERSSHATHATVPVTQLIRKPAAVGWEAAGSLYIAGCTAYAAVRAIDPKRGETVAVSGAAGGVGSIVTQLLRHRGARVLGIASDSSAETLRHLGAIPIAYGEGLAQRLTDAAPQGIDAFIDLFGPEYVELVVALGIPPERIETIISFAAAEKYGTKADGSGTASNREALTEMANLVADGIVQVPIAARYPLDDVQAAFAELEKRHTHGKIVLIPS